MTLTTADLARGIIASGFDNARIDELPRFGGYLLFAGNGEEIEGVRAVTDALRARHEGDAPPIIAIDQEGGRVARLREGVEPMPSMMSLGAAGDLDLARRAGEQIAFDLRRAGCTLDFAPVLDLALEPENLVIGTRSFGSDPRAVAALAERVARGMRAGGIVPCYKHFPGHGSTRVDSHVALPVVDADEATLRARDFAPFEALAKDAPAMMAAHVVLRALDAGAPASLSPRVGVSLLRGEFGFGGAYLTDCLEMGALSGEGKTVDASVVALSAGADLLLFSHQPDVAAESAIAIVKAVESGSVPRSRLEEAYARIAALRRTGQPPLPLDEFPPHPGVGREIARRAVTVVRGIAHADPTASYVFDFAAEPIADNRILLNFSKPSLKMEAPALKNVTCSLDDDNTEAVLHLLGESRRRPILLARRAHLHPPQAQTINNVIERYPDAVVVSMLEPFDLACFPGARHLIAAYGDDAAAIGGLADVIFGGIMAQGTLPVEYATAVG